jgi:lipoate-protein ligase A
MTNDENLLDFRLLHTGPCGAAEHMCLDAVIMEARDQGTCPNTLRFLRFPRCALVGLHQNTALEVNVEYCRGSGVQINRRITGGGALYCGQAELGLELYASKATPGIPADVTTLYRVMCQALVGGLRKLGLNAAHRPVNDIEVSGRKIAGTSGGEVGEAMVFQCSLLVDFDVDEMLRVLRLSLEKLGDKACASFRDRVTWVGQELGFIPERERLEEALLAGLSEYFDFRFTPGELNPGELSLLEKKLPDFTSEKWIMGEKGGVIHTVDAWANHKAPGGLIRVNVRLDRTLRRFMSVLITGDFIAYPPRFVHDLEAGLRTATADWEAVGGVVGYFLRKHQACLPGVSQEDLTTAVLAAVDKARAVQGRAAQGPRSSEIRGQG